MICLNCGIEFTDSKHPDRKYCSLDCSTQSQKRRVIKICPTCGREFGHDRKASHTNKHTYCSKKCGGIATKKSDPDKKSLFVCGYCHKTFENWTYRNPRFCSVECHHAAQVKPEAHIHLICSVCGKPYTRIRYFLEQRNSSCCSKECFAIMQSALKRGSGNPNYRGGSVEYRGANWRRQSRLARIRDGYTCQICHKKVGKKRHDHGVHHIKPYREFNGNFESANKLTNLITLCNSCHSTVEFGKLACPIPLF